MMLSCSRISLSEKFQSRSLFSCLLPRKRFRHKPYCVLKIRNKNKLVSRRPRLITPSDKLKYSFMP